MITVVPNQVGTEWLSEVTKADIKLPGDVRRASRSPGREASSSQDGTKQPGITGQKVKREKVKWKKS